MNKICIFKRSTLILIPIQIVIPFYINFNNYLLFYIIPCSVISTIILIVNFPILIKMLHTRPVYYEDILLIDKCVDNPYELQNIFLYVNGTTSIIFVIISCIYLYTKIQTSANIIDTIGIFGGLVILYSKFQMYIGKGVLAILFYIKTKKYNTDGIEMIQLTDSSSQVSDNKFLTDMPWLWCWCDKNSNQKCHLCKSKDDSLRSLNNTPRDSPVFNIPHTMVTPRSGSPVNYQFT